MPILKAEIALYPNNLLDIEPDSSSDRRWWAVYTKARQEKAFVRQLHGMEVPFYLPLIPKDNVVRGKRVQSHIPLFGGYVFMFGNEHERVQSLTTNRVSTMLAVEDQHQLVADLRQVACLINANAPLTVESRLSPGDRVRIKNGPMMGLEGVVVTRRGMTRLLVAVTMLQQGVSVEIDDYILEPI